MILSKEQNQRYLRQIIMSEIGSAGQINLLEATVLLYSENVDQAASLVYYLAAAGIGNIRCHFNDTEGYDVLFSNIKDFNADVCIRLESDVDSNSPTENPPAVRIIIGSLNYYIKHLDTFTSADADSFAKTIIGISLPWMGLLHAALTLDDFNLFYRNLHDVYIKSSLVSSGDMTFQIGSTLTDNLLGCTCAIEAIKLCLNIGVAPQKILEFDLLSMDFIYKDKDKNVEMLEEMLAHFEAYTSQYAKKEALERYSHILSDLKVLIVGAGGLGSPAAYALTKAGVGTIGLIDYDCVEMSNLNRQIMHSPSRIGMLKVESGKVFLSKIRSDINIITHPYALTKENAKNIVKEYDIIIDALDSLPTRYILNDACHFSSKPMIEAGVSGFYGLAANIKSGEGPCYRCIFPEMPDYSSIPSGTENKVLGPVPGVMGTIEAAEAIKTALGIGEPLKGRLLMFDALETDFSIVNMMRNPACPLCGSNPSIGV